MKNINVGFAGMTHLGLVSAISATEKGVSVICFDQNTELIDLLSAGKLPVSEPKLGELLIKNRGRISFTSEIDLLTRCDVVYVAPDIPTNSAGTSELTALDDLLELVLSGVSQETVIVLLSQVPPGYARTKAVKHKNFYYQVETLIFGRAVDRALFPERYIIGTHNPELELPEKWLYFLELHECPIIKMKFESAELAKIAINMYLVSSVVTTNVLAEICEKIGAEWREISPALKLDKRIGEYAYLSPGLGIAGGNLERDLATVQSIASNKGTDDMVVGSWKRNSQYRKDWPLRFLHKNIFPGNKNPVIGVLGLAYKPETHSIKNSPAIMLIDGLQNITLKCYDPVVKKLDRDIPNLTICQTSYEVCSDVDILIIMTAWSEFSSLSLFKIRELMRGSWILDPYGVLPMTEAISLDFKYARLGSAHEV